MRQTDEQRWRRPADQRHDHEKNTSARTNPFANPRAAKDGSRISTLLQNGHVLGAVRQLLPGGYLKFYSAGTTTPKDVFGEKALTTNNSSTIALDASSRPSLDVWGSGAYFVEIYDTDDNKQGEADNVEIPGGEATAFPELEAGST